MASSIGKERRRAPRYRLIVQVKLEDGSVGKSLDMSTGGIFLETDQCYPLGALIRFSMVIHESVVQCRGSVVRAEPREGRFGIAVELDRYEFT